jgi:RNA polymerase sigma factor (sigma-70 family)
MNEPAIPPEFDELLQHRSWVRRLCRHLVANQAEADEVEQDAWRRAIEAPPRHAGNLRSWLSSVVRSSAAQRHRGESRRTRAHERFADQQLGSITPGSTRPDDPASPDALAERRETFEMLNRLLAELEAPYGEVVYLRFVPVE